ncbi:FAD-dependent oxidoreductase [Halanaerobium sp. Z-7514]|uniref:FAD-dependent oxidoreductase n=1 Tax=Halanaerobium polyolivorans TaxID=2886943 RepID=A0AAW4WWP6_9FIRM|nr:FAD-dependent oxidoreductase [Halanaerobium polyolivorans]MCC3145145.1 FAD-dependent oxidoreductase [Halanaerobium polyolivorans]
MKRYELIIIGAGPAGLSAAIEAAAEGMEVIVFDENQKPGGQLFKQIHKFFGSKQHRARERGFKIGEDLLKKAEDYGVEVKLNSTVIGLFDSKTVSVKIADSIEHYSAYNIIVAAGASEKMIPFPGWTLPGVIGAGAAQTMMNIEGVKPGEDVLMVGSGNVGLVVGYQLIQAGSNLKAVIDASEKIGGYGVHAAKLARTGVPFYTSHTLKELKGETEVEKAIITEVDENWQPISGSEKEIKVDTVCLAVGLSPMSKLLEMAGCQMKSEAGDLIPICDQYSKTSLEGIYAAGDVAGIEEASAAMVEGRIAAASILKELSYLDQAEFEARFSAYKASLEELRQGMFGIGEGSWDYPQKSREGYPLAKTLLKKGYLKAEELKKFPGFIDKKSSEVIPIIECTQNIPCDPCQDICPKDCIKVEGDIVTLPELDENFECSACELCVAACPGQALFLVNHNYSNNYSSVSFPYEFFPLPELGSRGKALDRAGKVVGEAEIIKVNQAKINDKTAVLTMKVKDAIVDQARFFKEGDF